MSAAVRRREVFFLGGFDPKRPSHYHAMYVREAKRQAQLDGVELKVGELVNQDRVASHWHVEGVRDGVRTSSKIEVLRWDDIVRRHWTCSGWRILARSWVAAGQLLAEGALWPLFRMAKIPVVAALLPLIVNAVAMAAGGVVCGALASWLGADAPVRWAAILVGATVAMASSAAVMARRRLTWFAQLALFIGAHADKQLPQLDERINEFASRLIAHVHQSEADEILVVGHSVGSILAASALARAIGQAPDLTLRRPRIALMTLGHCIPLLGRRDSADWFRSELRALAGSGIDWLDVTSPIDWAAFPLVDPLHACGVEAAASATRPHLASPRFHLLFTPAGYARLRRNRFRVHMQYLLATERPGAYDYFALTAGPLPLSARRSTLGAAGA